MNACQNKNACQSEMKMTKDIAGNTLQIGDKIIFSLAVQTNSMDNIYNGNTYSGVIKNIILKNNENNILNIAVFGIRGARDTALEIKIRCNLTTLLQEERERTLSTDDFDSGKEQEFNPDLI